MSAKDYYNQPVSTRRRNGGTAINEMCRPAAAAHQTQHRAIEASVAVAAATIPSREATHSRAATEDIHSRAATEATPSRVATEAILNSRTVNSNNQYTSNSSLNNLAVAAARVWAVAVLGKFLPSLRAEFLC